MPNRSRRIAVSLLAALVGAALAVAVATGAAPDLDSSFGTGGVVTLAPGAGADAAAAAVVRLSDGSLAVTGRAADGPTKVLLARYAADGTPSPAFNGGAAVLRAFGSGSSEGQGLALDGSGRLLVAGTAVDGAGAPELFVARFSAAGALDSTFAAGAGVAYVVPVAGATSLAAPAIAIDSQGRILVGGHAGAGPQHDFVARFTSAGVLDTAGFAATGTFPGVALAQVRGASDSRVEDLVIDGSDRVVFAGSAKTAGTTDLLAGRLTSSGAIDTTFGAGSAGFLAAPLGDGGDATAYGVVLQNGKPVLAGRALDGGKVKVALARVAADGSALDAGFHAGGTELEAIGPGDALLRDLVLDPSGRLVGTGRAAAGGGTRAIVARFDADGGLDDTFGSGGVVGAQPATVTAAQALVLQPDGKVVIAGGAGASALLARFGTPDTAPTPTTTMPATTPTSTTPAPEPPPAPSVPTGLAGPDQVKLGEPAIFTAQGGLADVAHVQWDLGGSGAFATDGAKTPTIQHAFGTVGDVKVGVRLTDSKGKPTTFFRTVKVVLPPLAQLRWHPFNPKAGQKVTFTLDTVQQGAIKPAYFRWDIPALKPLGTRISLPGVRNSGARNDGLAHVSAAQQASSIELTSKDADLSKTNQYARTFPKTGVFEVVASAVATDGTLITTHARIGVGQSKIAGAGDVTPQDCALDPNMACPEITTAGELVSGFPITFSAETPEPGGKCLPPTANPDTAVEQIKNLGYPVDFGQIGGQVGGQFNGQVGGQAIGGGRRAAPRAHAAQCLKPLTSVDYKVLQWSFGDGAKVPAGALNKSKLGPDVLQHNYAQPGSYQVTVVAKVTTVSTIPKATSVAYVKDTITVDVVKPFCGTLYLHTVPATTKHCFVPVTPAGSPHPQYRPYAGETVDLGGLTIIADVGASPIVDADGAKIVATQGQLFAQLRYGPGGYENGHVPQVLQFGGYGNNTLEIPAPAYQQEIKKTAVMVPAFTQQLTFTQIGGLNIVGGHVYLSHDQPARAHLFLKMPPVYTGNAEIDLDATKAKTAGIDDADFTAALPDAWIGPFQTKGVFISHRKIENGGGWFGGGSILLFGSGLDAPYMRAGQGNTSVKCGKGGPSGFSLSEDGDFEFAGATLKLASDIPLGPVGLHCLQVAGDTEPFTLQGKVALRLPVDTNIIRLDACFLVAVLEKDDVAHACGLDYKAKQEETWFHAGGVVSLLDTLDLASAHFDLHKGPDLFKVAVGGAVDFDFEIIELKVGVEGIIYFQPKFAFEFDGYGKLKLGICPICVKPSVEAIVSSNGIAACAVIAGFEYLWDDGLSVFLGCDLSDSDVHIERALPSYRAVFGSDAAADAPLGATSRQTFKVGSGLHTLALEATGAGGAPTLMVTDPKGHRYTDSGTFVAPENGQGFLHLENVQRTAFTVKGTVPAGTWTVEIAAGSPAITGLRTRHDLAPARVRARVVGRGQHRRLKYLFTSARGRSVTFLEEGGTVGRSLGTVTKGHGTLAFPKGFGERGPRRIKAIVAQDGLSRERSIVARYRAEGPPRVARPKGLRTTRSKGGLIVRWRPVAHAAHYTLVARLGDGRRMKLELKRPLLRIPTFPRGTTMTASVVAVAAGRKGPAAHLRVRAGRRKVRIVM